HAHGSVTAGDADDGVLLASGDPRDGDRALAVRRNGELASGRGSTPLDAVDVEGDGSGNVRGIADDDDIAHAGLTAGAGDPGLGTARAARRDGIADGGDIIDHGGSGPH